MKALKNIFPLALLCLGLTSCLDDEYRTGNSDEMPNTVEFADVATVNASSGYIYPVYSRSFAVVPQDEFDVTISYSGTNQAPEDIVVDVTVDPTIISAYNNKIVADARAAAMEGIEDPEEAEEEADHAEEEVQEQLFDVAPASVYSLSTNQVTIKKGERATTMTVTVKPELFDFAFKYGIPLKLSTNQATVSGNFGRAIFAIGAKNAYDGVYTVEGTMVDRTNPAFVGYYPKTIELRTLDVNTNEYYDIDFDIDGHIFDTGSGASYYGNFQAVFNFDNSNTTDLTDPVASVINNYGQPAPGATARAATIEATGVNTFTFDEDGTPKTMEVTYTMIQAGSPRTTWTETYTYTGPRD
ncbi:DUF1735 domain-containing protein [Rufibacter psychrotolerans]|uniref:DUF1735 domain-containing protein n=1 Tax=Rufibacter psychrotolerans TaxID=2812556 RepID=UPI001967B367|nr:DUF1735 domain-containing protein [Rufibacter sp. SYSU D00308]